MFDLRNYNYDLNDFFGFNAFNGNADLEETPVNKDIDMEKFIEILGLAPEATEEEVFAAIKQMADKLAEYARKEEEIEKAKQAEMEKELEEEAIEILDACGDLDEETKKKAVNSFKADPEAGRLFAQIFKPKAAVVNFDSAKKPEVEDITDFQKKLNSLPGGEARVKYLLNLNLNK